MTTPIGLRFTSEDLTRTDFRRIAQSLRTQADLLDRVQGEFGELADEGKDSLQTVRQESKRTDAGLRELAIGAGILGAGLLATTKSTLDAAVGMETLRTGMISVVGSAAEADRQLVRLRAVAEAPGLGFEEAIQGSIRLQSVRFEAQLAERTLLAFGNAIAQAGGGRLQLDRVILQLVQMQGKGRILAEEFNTMAESMPQLRGAMEAAFNGATLDQIRESGISVTEFTTRIVAELEKLGSVGDTTANRLENLNDKFSESQRQLGEHLLPTYNSLIETASSLLDRFNELSDTEQRIIAWGTAIGGATATAIAGAAGLSLALPALISGVTGLGVALRFLATNPIGIAITAAAALTAVFLKQKAELDALTTRYDRLTKAVQENNRAVIESEGRRAIDELLDVQAKIVKAREELETAEILGKVGLGFFIEPAKQDLEILEKRLENLRRALDLASKALTTKRADPDPDPTPTSTEPTEAEKKIEKRRADAHAKEIERKEIERDAYDRLVESGLSAIDKLDERLARAKSLADVLQVRQALEDLQKSDPIQFRLFDPAAAIAALLPAIEDAEKRFSNADAITAREKALAEHHAKVEREHDAHWDEVERRRKEAEEKEARQQDARLDAIAKVQAAREKEREGFDRLVESGLKAIESLESGLSSASSIDDIAKIRQALAQLQADDPVLFGLSAPSGAIADLTGELDDAERALRVIAERQREFDAASQGADATLKSFGEAVRRSREQSERLAQTVATLARPFADILAGLPSAGLDIAAENREAAQRAADEKKAIETQLAEDIAEIRRRSDLDATRQRERIVELRRQAAQKQLQIEQQLAQQQKGIISGVTSHFIGEIGRMFEAMAKRAIGGAILGGVIGFVAGGPAGALQGAKIGAQSAIGITPENTMIGKVDLGNIGQFDHPDNDRQAFLAGLLSAEGRSLPPSVGNAARSLGEQSAVDVTTIHQNAFVQKARQMTGGSVNPSVDNSEMLAEMRANRQAIETLTRQLTSMELKVTGTDLALMIEDVKPRLVRQGRI